MTSRNAKQALDQEAVASSYLYRALANCNAQNLPPFQPLLNPRKLGGVRASVADRGSVQVQVATIARQANQH